MANSRREVALHLQARLLHQVQASFGGDKKEEPRQTESAKKQTRYGEMMIVS